MSILAPLYFLGALAVGLPILFHLIRRQPKGQVEFSSLMFLRPTPPRLTRRSRLDNWPLLLLRALVLMLLAAAFTRPFLRSTALSDAQIPGRRLVLVVDTSASMQRAGLWQQALDRSSDVIDDLRREDELAIVTFDSKPTTLMSFEQSSRLTLAQVKTTAKQRLKDLTPTWQATEMGRAISYAADLAVTFEPDDSTSEQTPTEPTVEASAAHLILVSDMQVGSEIESLQTYAWPDSLRLDVRNVTSPDRTNANIAILSDENASESAEGEDDRVRVRVTNAADSTESRFQLGWSAVEGGESTELPVQVPPGETRVVRVPKPAPGVASIVIKGDDHSYDNVHYVVSPEPTAYSLLHIGGDDRDPRNSLLYYLQRVPLNSPYRQVQVETMTPEKAAELTITPDPKRVPLIVLEQSVAESASDRLQSYVDGGGRLLIVLADEANSAALTETMNQITNSQARVSEAEVRDYAMLSKIDFRNVAFQAMSDPKFNDFTKVRFWSHRKLTNLQIEAEAGDDVAAIQAAEAEEPTRWDLVATFDDGDPAIVQTTIGDGQVLVMAAGWQPEASQLALSTKFIPFVFSLFAAGRGDANSSGYVIGEAIDITPSQSATITGPTGIAVDFRSTTDLAVIDQPGVYEFRDGDSQRRFAVNLSEAESRTEALGDDALERFDVVLGKAESTAQTLANQRQLRDLELENRQKLWQWLLLAALALIGLETWWGAHLSRRRESAGQPAAVATE